MLPSFSFRACSIVFWWVVFASPPALASDYTGFVSVFMLGMPLILVETILVSLALALKKSGLAVAGIVVGVCGVFGMLIELPDLLKRGGHGYLTGVSVFLLVLFVVSIGACSWRIARNEALSRGQTSSRTGFCWKGRRLKPAARNEALAPRRWRWRS